MLPYRDSRITVAALGVFFVLMLIYAYIEAKDALFGPRIAIEVPESVSSPLITLAGSAEHISELRLNGNPIPVTEEGAFDEPYLLAPGYNRIVFEAKDQYGRERTQVLEIHFTPLPESPSLETASTSVVEDSE